MVGQSDQGSGRNAAVTTSGRPALPGGLPASRPLTVDPAANPRFQRPPGSTPAEPAPTRPVVID